MNKNKKQQKQIVMDGFMAGRPFPCVPDLEDVVIGALQFEGDAFSRIESILTDPEMFSRSDNRIIFETIRSMYFNNEVIDMLTIREKIRSIGKLEEAGGDYNIANKVRNLYSSAHIETHARIIQQKWMQRQVMCRSLQAYDQASDDTFDISDVIEDLNKSIYDIQALVFCGQFLPLEEIVRATNRTVNANMSRGDELLGISSGIHLLDEIMLGFQDSDFIVIAARPAMGKTAFVGTISKYISVDKGIGCAVFSLEMSAQQLMMRYFSMVSGVEFQKIRRGSFSKSELSSYDIAVQRMLQSKLIIDDTPSLSIEEFRSKIKHMVRTQGVKIAFIDYLQLMTVRTTKFSTRQEEVSYISKVLKSIAKELNIPVIALSQLNRETETKASEGARPKLSNLRESGAIEQDADIVCFIHRPEYYGLKTEIIDGKTVNWTGKAEIIIAKHRNGVTGSITLDFKSKAMLFSDPMD